jgi:NADH dehydrogenase FAD-containing subunit
MRKVLVIGGGFGGLTTITSLRKFDKTVEIILVEPKQYFEVAWCAYRALFDSQLADDAIFDLPTWATAKSVTHIRSTVTSLSQQANTATLANGDVIEFTVCVIACGATTKWPALGRGLPSDCEGHDGTRGKRLEILAAQGKKLTTAKSVLIIGGGLIGTELAGDLAYYSKEQQQPPNNGNRKDLLKITLVHSQEQLIPEFTPRAAAMAKKKLENLGVVIILNDKVVKNKEGNKCMLQKAKTELIADEVVYTSGLSPIALPFLQDASLCDAKGWIQVDDYFRVKGAEQKFFAIGDCCDLLPNSGVQVMGNVGIIGKNIKVVLDAHDSVDKPGAAAAFDSCERRMRKALANPELYVATIGKKTGVALTPCCHTQFLLPAIKNSTMFLMKPKGEFGLK